MASGDLPASERATLESMVRPLSTRSIVLSLLLGYDQPQLTSRDLVRVGQTFAVTENSMRVTLSRMSAAGDLERSATGYRLAPRLIERQRRQSAALDPATRPWRGDWTILVITDRAEGTVERQRRRQMLHDLRMASVRPGVWMRPDNLEADAPAEIEGISLRVVGPVDRDDVQLARELWDLEAWSRLGRGLIDRLAVDQPAQDAMAVAAAMIRLLRSDPLLPEPLLPADWVGSHLRATYRHYREQLIALHAQLDTQADQVTEQVTEQVTDHDAGAGV